MKQDEDWPTPRPPWFERMAIVAACATVLFVFKGDLGWFLGKTRDNLRNQVRENLPIASEIERTRELAAALVPDLRRNHEVIVREQVEIDELRAEIEESQKRILRQREQLFAMRAELRSQTEQPPSKDAKVTTANLRRELQQRFQTLQTQISTEDAKTQTLKYRQESLEKAMAVQSTMLHKKQQLEAKVAELDARLKLLAHEGVDNRIVADQEHLARCEEQLRYLKKRLSIAEGVSKFNEHNPSISAPDDIDSPNDSLDAEIDRFLDQKPDLKLFSSKPQ